MAEGHQEPEPWNPTVIERVVQVFGTSTVPAYVKTDAGYGYAKALGNPEGPIVLTCDWLGVSLAALLGIPAVEPAIVRLHEALCWSLDPDDPKSDRVLPGPAFVTREVKATVWDGSSEMLNAVANSEMLTGLLVLDTWLRNADRYSPDGRRENVNNVLLAEEGAPKGKYRVVAMDFSHAVTGGYSLSSKHVGIDAVRDERIYGCFPAFRPYLQLRHAEEFTARMREVRQDQVRQIVSQAPPAWGVPEEFRARLVSFVVQRADYLADKLAVRLKDEWNLAEART